MSAGGRRVVVRTHGGLGNQLFQMLHARLVAGAREPAVIHDANYPHAFPLSAMFRGHPAPTTLERAISAARIPKLLERARLSGGGAIALGGTIFLDGYFQAERCYAAVAPALLAAALDRLGGEAGVRRGEVQGGELHHIRLGDFFASEADQRDYLAGRLRSLPDGAVILTNRDDLVADAIARTGRDLILLPSAGASAEETLRLMSGYATIVSNDSTLAFWAACLGRRRLVTPDPHLAALFARLARAAGGGEG